MTRIILSIYILTLWVSNSFSQELSTHWVSYPLPNDSSEVLFCHTYYTQEKPLQASISFASTGRLRVYVNERNISQDICFTNSETNIIIHTYDVTRFLRPDSNVIAVWYAPVQGQPISKQLSLEYYGKDAHHRDFYYKADGNWQCKLLEGCYIKDNQYEYFDACQYDYNWKAMDYQRENWLKPLGALANDNVLSLSCDSYPSTSNRLRRILTPIETNSKDKEITCDFEYPFIGSLRLTIRDAKKGTVLKIGNLTYTCCGCMDEQAYLRFLNHNIKSISIHEEDLLKQIQIINIEGLECQ